MPTKRSQRTDLNPSSPSPTLADRVKARVVEAGHILDNRRLHPDATHPERRKGRRPGPAETLRNSAASRRDVLALRYVYSEMRTLYRTYRRQTGMHAVPALRSAVHAFRRGPSLTSLVHVATFLDERALLRW